MKLVIRHWSFVIGLWAVAAMAADPQRVTVFDVESRTSSGSLRSLQSESLTVRSETDRVWKWADVVSLRFEDRGAPAAPRGAAIWLANGDRCVARTTAIRDEQLIAEWVRFTDWSELKAPLESVRGMSLALPQIREQRDGVAAWLLDRRAGRDDVRLMNGDLISGEVDRLQNGAIVLTSGAKEVSLPVADVREVGFNTELLTLPEAKELCWLASLSDGSQLTLLAAKSRLAGDKLQAAHVSGAKLEISLDSLRELRVLHGRTVYLSDLTPVEMRHTPFLAGSREWSLQRDRAVSGNPLRLGSHEFPKGLGMHSRSVATFEISGQYRAFYAVVGLDATTTGPGTADCAVEIEGRRVQEFSVSRTSQAKPIGPIDVTGAKRLTLIVDFGSLGDVQDHVNWCDAVLLP